MNRGSPNFKFFFRGPCLNKFEKPCSRTFKFCLYIANNLYCDVFYIAILLTSLDCH